jgi:hypothetical protein
MKTFRDILWGIELEYPDDWAHKSEEGAECFAASPEALSRDYDGPRQGTLVLRLGWNSLQGPVRFAWEHEIGKMASFLGAKNVRGSAWQAGGVSGWQASLEMPKKDLRSVWTGILDNGYTLAQVTIAYLKKETDWFWPIASEMLRSLRFVSQVSGLEEEDGIPLPPGCAPIDPRSVVDDIADEALGEWRAYDGAGPIGALQAFYLREAPIRGWEVSGFAPFPSTDGFASMLLEREGQSFILGLLPYGDPPSPSRAAIVLRRQGG